MQPKNEKPRSNQRRRREMKRNNHNPESKWRARSGCLVGSRDWAARFPAAECFSPLPGKQPPLGIKHGWGRGHKNWDFTSSSSCKQSGTVPRLSMRAKLVISYANGGAGSFRGKVCLKSGSAMFLPIGDISCSKYFDLGGRHLSSLWVAKMSSAAAWLSPAANQILFTE